MSYHPLAAITNRVNNWTANQVPGAAGTTDIGTSAVPWRYLFLGDSANTVKLNADAATADREVYFPDSDSTTVIGTTATATQFLTHVTAAGVQVKAQPAFSDLSGTFTVGMLPDGVITRTGHISGGTPSMPIQFNGAGGVDIQLNPSTGQTSRIMLTGDSYATVLVGDSVNTDVGRVMINGVSDSYLAFTGGHGRIIYDLTGGNLTQIIFTNPTGGRVFTIPDADSNPVRPDTGTANNFLTAISSTGVISKAQPSYSNLSGSGSTSITTVGTITAGVWNGTALTSAYLPAAVAYTNAPNDWTSDQLPDANLTRSLGSPSKNWFMYGQLSVPGTTGAPGHIYAYNNAGANLGDTGSAFNALFLGDAVNPATYVQVCLGATLTGGWQCKLPDANSNTVIPDTGAANNFLTAISSGGVISKAQPSSSNLSDAANIALVNNANNFTTSQLPNATATYNLGSNSKLWDTVFSKNLTLGNTAGGYDPELYIIGGGQARISIGEITGATTTAVMNIRGSSATINLTGSSTAINLYDATQTFYQSISSASLSASRTCTLPDANSNTVIPDTGAANNFLTAISSSGVISKAQPTYSNLSGNGSTNITTVGTITAGVWNGTALTSTYLPIIPFTLGGGAADLSGFTTGSFIYKGASAFLALAPSSNKLAGFNNAGTAPEAKILASADLSVTITHTAGNIDLSVAGGPGGVPKWTASDQATSFTAGTTSFTYYRCTGSTAIASQVVTLDASPADGTVIKFKNLGTGLLSIVPNGNEVFESNSEVIEIRLIADSAAFYYPSVELIAVTGGWEIN